MSWASVALSLEVSALALALAGLTGVGCGALLARRRFPGRELVDALLTAPMVLPPTVLGYYLLVLFGRGSALGHAYEAVTGGPLVFSLAGAVLAAAVGAFPLVVKSARAAFAEVDLRLVAAARSLGAGPWRTFTEVELPLARRGLASGLGLGFARALGDFGVTLMVAGNLEGVTRTAPLAIYDALQAGRDAEAGALSLVMAVVGVGVVLAVNALGARR